MDDSASASPSRSATYENLFPEQLADKCSPDALESQTGPLAYLNALYAQALELEKLGEEENTITLADRRPDIGALLLDTASLEQNMPALTLVIQALERQARQHAGEKTDLARVICEAKYPAGLPFHEPLETLKSVLKEKEHSLFDLLQQSEYSFPNFSYANLRTSELRQVMRNAAGFSPALQTLLLENNDAADDLFLKCYGVDGDSGGALARLNRVDFLCRQTGLKTESIQDMLATSGVADDGTEAFTSVKRSSAYRPPSLETELPLAGHLFGAVFINNATAPALSLKDMRKGAGISLSITGTNASHFARIHKIIHLQHALQLPFADVDLLVMSALRAEGQTEDFHLTENTLRALGVFIYLKDTYGVSAEQFSALIANITPFGAGEGVPFLDRILDGPGAGQAATVGQQWVLDDSALDLAANTSTAALGNICRAFALEESVARVYMQQISAAMGQPKPVLSLATCSSLYRLTRLPRLLRLSQADGASLISLLAKDSPTVLAMLAGTPRIHDDPDLPDILDVLVGLMNLERWLRRQNISAQALLRWLTPLPENIPESLQPLLSVGAHIKQTISDALPRLRSSLMGEKKFAAELNAKKITPASGTWLTLLSDYVDSTGLVRPITLQPKQTLVDTLEALLKDKVSSPAGSSETIALDAAHCVHNLISNAVVAQEDVLVQIVNTAFKMTKSGLTSAHMLPLLRWINTSPFSVMADVLAAYPERKASPSELDSVLWSTLERHAQAIGQLRVSAVGLNALLDHPEWFDLTSRLVPQATIDVGAKAGPALNLDLCYQITRYRDWIETCKLNGFNERDALNYLSPLPGSDQPGAVEASAERMGVLLNWGPTEAILAMPVVNIERKKTAPATVKTFQDFVNNLTPEEVKVYKPEHLFWTVCQLHANFPNPDMIAYSIDKSLYQKFNAFLSENSQPIKLDKPSYSFFKQWESIHINSCNERKPCIIPITAELCSPGLGAPGSEAEYSKARCVPSTISDIDFILRLLALCKTTGLSCQSLLDLTRLDEKSDFDDFYGISQLMLGACSDTEREHVEAEQQTQWRDALMAWLVAYWVPTAPSLSVLIPNAEYLSDYILTDAHVSGAVKTTTATQAIASLQHYIHRLFAHLEPGYEQAILPEEAADNWRQHLSEYGNWKQWRSQINHPENLIYYAHRPNKSKAFEELEVEINQGKLDRELLQTAITGYLTKFEKTSNLQVVSGYLDGFNPKTDTYHFIGKTNASPPEYYWRSLDMGLRDTAQRLSPLAWSEWEKIGIPVSGQITQSSFTHSKTKEVIKCDTIRPLIIAGRPYVFWVERAITGLPSADEKNQTPTKYKKLTVFYAYKQSDGFWGPANELLCLDGTLDGKRLADKDNPYLKDDTYEPGLIAVVNVEGEREHDPWLTVMLYNCAYIAPTPRDKTPNNVGMLNRDFYIEQRDLLLIEKKLLNVPKTPALPEDTSDPNELKNTLALSNVIYNSYCDIRRIQHLYTGEVLSVATVKIIYGESRYALEKFKENAITSTYNSTLTLNKDQNSYLKDIVALETEIDDHHPLFRQLDYFPILAGKDKVVISDYKVRTAYTFLETLSLFLDAPSPHHKPTQKSYSPLPLQNMSLTIAHRASTTIKIHAFFPQKIFSKPDDNYTKIDLRLYVKLPKESTFKRLIEESVVADGEAAITHEYQPSESGEYMFALCEAGNPLQNVFVTCDIRKQGVDELWDISIKRNNEQAQYLDLTAVANEAPKFPSNVIRLNTLFGKQLVARAAQSIERALEWDSQLIKEPTIDGNIPTPTVDFHGANGGYFRELFLHLPALVATRLSEAQQFEDAERWYTRYLFDPYRSQQDALRRPPFWNTRPLAEVGSGSSELQKTVDPMARAFSLSRPYQQAVFLSLVENWQRQGDHFYRQLTRSSLNHAWLSYQQASNLLGPLPERASISRWTPMALEQIDFRSFRVPINERLTRARGLLQSRLFNLRHGLTLDGKALPPMDWRNEGGDPFGFASGGVGSLTSSYNSDRASIPAYRFRQLMPMARAAVRQLQDMGRHYMKLMEDESYTTFAALLKKQEMRISDFTLRLKREAINSVVAKRRILQLGKEAAVFRRDYYTDLLQTGRSPIEEAATGLIWTSAALKTMSLPFHLAAGITESLIPTIYGLAVGGNNPSAPMAKTALTLAIAGDASMFLAEQLMTESSYERRAQEWQFEMKQAELDIQAIELEIAESNIELNASTISLEESQQERTNLEEAYVAMTTGFTIIPIYNWLVAQQESLYGPAYDAVLSLCLSVEAAWRYEIGDYKWDTFIKTSAWNDSYKGMLAGESLLVDLQEMENAYLLCNERRLSIRKTVDLRGVQTDQQWLATIKGLADKPLEFELKSSDFDKNYPGHYLRQLKHVSVSFVLNAGVETGLDNISAILTQTSSTTLVEPSNEGADYLYASANKPPACIKRNLRAQQQIALSSALADDGLGFGKDDWVYELMFHDGRYLPFEGTGAISRWQLSFPDVDFAKSLSKSLVKTIQLNIVYTAVDGGPAFTDKIKALMKPDK
jgi:hypothetical protein